MTVTKLKIKWWLYLLWIAISIFAVPSLVSAADTFLVLLGILWMIAMVVVSWKFWARNLLKEITK